ncbi:hypothetical protein [Cyanobium sp. Morenito 9A2]|uniref:hypothetical protein n=1 Tax=Cyanobium sp. Morenito 9A2 TaxID=2823718 RepID=UPI0020CF2602|nr:hypothetical protein [Cyanobium sp. Morenito 9A2]MCP9848854.1 hypothetical protein [Cyanobium sp. Morenito 9A2]
MAETHHLVLLAMPQGLHEQPSEGCEVAAAAFAEYAWFYEAAAAVVNRPVTRERPGGQVLVAGPLDLEENA